MDKRVFAAGGLTLTAMFALSGCFGGSSSSNGGGDGGQSGGGGGDTISSSLSSEEQALAAGIGISAAAGEADGVADGVGDMVPAEDLEPAPGGLAAAQTISCESGGPIQIDSEATVSSSDAPFPSVYYGEPPMQGNGATLQADNCSMEGVRIDGQYELFEFGDLDAGQGAMYARFGGTSAGDANIAQPMVMDGGLVDMRMQGYMSMCYSCVDGHLGTIGIGSTVNDATMVALFSMEMPDMRLQMGRMDGLAPLMVIATAAAGGGASVSVDGRQAFEDETCAFDVTMHTVDGEDLLVRDWGGDAQDIESGKMEVTANDSGQSHVVEWINGEPYVDGEPPAPEAMEAIAGCGDS